MEAATIDAPAEGQEATEALATEQATEAPIDESREVVTPETPMLTPGQPITYLGGPQNDHPLPGTFLSTGPGGILSIQTAGGMQIGIQADRLVTTPTEQGEAAAPESLVPLKINVPDSAAEHFWEEPPPDSEEFWAFKEKPNAVIGQSIVFRIAGGVVAEAVVGRIEEPGESKCDGAGRFKNHWKVYWPPESFKDLREGSATAETPKDETPVGSRDVPIDPDRLKKHLGDIEEQERTVRFALSEYEEAKEEASRLKKEHEKEVDRLCRLIRDFHQPAPLFEQAKNVAAEPASSVKKPAENITENITDPDAWMSLPLSALKLSEKVVTLLTENGVTTFGQLEDLRASRWEKPKIRGLGEKKQQEIEDAVVGYWTEHPQEKPAAEPRDDTQAVSPGLVWLQGESEFQHVAVNTAGIQSEDGGPAMFRIEVEQGRVMVDLTDTELWPEGGQLEYDSLDAAKAWAETTNAKLVEQRAAPDAAPQDDKPAEPAPIADHPGVPIIGAKGKTWAVKLAVHPRTDDTWAHTWECKLGDFTNESPLEGAHITEHAATAFGVAAIREWVDAKIPDLDAKGTKAAQAVKAELEKFEQLTEAKPEAAAV